MYFNNKPTPTNHPVDLNWCGKCMQQPIHVSSQLCENHLGINLDNLSVSGDARKLSFDLFAKFEIEFDLCFDTQPEQKDELKSTTAEISDMVYTDDNCFILCCSGTRALQPRRSRTCEMHYCKKLLKYSEKGKYLSQCLMDETPRKICILPSKLEAVVTLGQKVQFVNLPEFSAGRSIIVGTDCTGIAIVDRMIFVGDSMKIHVMDQIGRLFKTIEAPCLLSSIHPNIDGRLYCTGGSSFYCMTKDGTVVYTYNSSVLGQVNFATFDSHGNIYVGGSEVQMFYPYKTQLDTIFHKEDEVGIVKAICFNADFTKMFIAHKNGSGIATYTCK